jgi:hypothetical protein
MIPMIRRAFLLTLAMTTLIALSRSTRADALVSGDPDVTGLDIVDVRVISPRELLHALNAAGRPANGGKN